MANYNDYLEYLKHIDNTTEQEIKDKVNALGDEISNLKTSLTNLNKVKDDLTTDLGNSRKQVNEKIDFINIKETELKKVSNDLVGVQKELKDTSLKLSELEKLHNIEQKKNATLINEITELKSKYSILENEAKTKNKIVNDYIAEIQKLHVDLESIKNDYSISQKINSDSNNNNSNNEQLNDEISKLNLELNQTKNSLESIRKEKQILENEVNNLKSKLSGSQNNKFEKENITLKQTIDQINTEVRDYCSQITDLKSDLKFKDDSLSKLKGDLDSKGNNYLPYIIGLIIGLFIMWLFAMNYNFYKNEETTDAVEVAVDTTEVEVWEKSDFLINLENTFAAKIKGEYFKGRISSDSISEGNYEFEGYIKRGFPVFGKATFEDGSFYEGEFDTNGMRTGKGRKVWSDGVYYEGDFVANEFEGNGKYYFEDGSYYEGQFSTSKFNGNGTMYKADGTLHYESFYVNGKAQPKK